MSVVAKGKKRRTEILDDSTAIAEFEKREYAVRKPTAKKKQHRDASPTANIISTWAAELQEIFSEFGENLDDDNARDKALTIWRQIHYGDGVDAHEKPVKHLLCEEHS